MKLNVMQIIKYLPKPNCRECGEATCMAFAAKLVKKETKIENCKPLFLDEYAQNRKVVEELLKSR